MFFDFKTSIRHGQTSNGAIAFFIILTLALIWGFFIEPNLIRVEKVSLEIKNLSPSFKNLKIVQLSDFHSKKFGAKEKKVLKILSELNPDFVFITGDIVDWTTRDLESCQIFWKELARNYPGRIFGVYGNHDHRNPRFTTLNDLLKESEIKILNNEARKIERNGDFIYLIGVDDPHLGYDDIEKAVNETERPSPKILLAHSPEVFRKVREKNIDLVLVGHTHGSQISVPFLENFYLPLEYDKKYKRDLFEEDSTYLYVNRGIGTTVLPIRFNSLPEITLITLATSH